MREREREGRGGEREREVYSVLEHIKRKIIYTITILLKSVGVRKLQVAILARSSRETSLTVRID